MLKLHKYATRKADTGAYNCRKITGGTGYSLHSYGIALDINWQSNPYGSRLVTDMPSAMIADIKAIRTKNGKQVWRWGGDYSGNKDAMHFEIIASPADIATGIDPKTVKGSVVTPPKKVGFRPGDSGAGVKFLQGMLNILAKYRINAKGKAGGAQIPLNGKYDARTAEAVRELQRFGNTMSKLAGGKGMKVDGIAGKDTMDVIAFWVPRALKK